MTKETKANLVQGISICQKHLQHAWVSKLVKQQSIHALNEEIAQEIPSLIENGILEKLKEKEATHE